MVAATSPAKAAEYYVDNTVSSSGTGTVSSPVKTIQEGLNLMSPGDILWIRGDTTGRVYTGSLSFPVSGTAGSPITIKNFPGERVILTGSSGTRMNLNKDYWTIDGLIIDQADIGSDAVKVNASHIIIRNSEIRDGRREGISIENASFVTIEDSYIHNFMWINSGSREDAHCIMIDTSRSPTITDIKIHRNTIERCSGDGTQIFAVTGQSISTYAKNIEFVDNIFLDGTTSPGLTENALDFKGGDTVLVKGNIMSGYINNKTIVVQKGCRNIVIEENTISDGLSGIELRQEGGVDFIQENNSIIKNIIYNMDTYALKFDGVRNVTVLHNTLFNIGTNSFRFESTLGSTAPAVDGGIIKNNLVMIAGLPKGEALLANVTSGSNGWFQAGGGGLSDSTDTTGTDPLFMNEPSGDFRLQSTSPAIDAGTPVGIAFFGPAPDLGALEYNPSGDTTPPAAPTGLQFSN